MKFDYTLLKSAIDRIGEASFLSAADLSGERLRLILDCGSYFTVSELRRAVDALKIGYGEIDAYFFTLLPEGKEAAR